MEENNAETCLRCKREGQDRRTLWMACFYDMTELELPFENVTLFHANMEDLEAASPPDDLVLDDKTKIRVKAGTVKSKGELYPQHLFTLRVCKDCRADWMRAIKSWFEESVEHEEGLRAGVTYVREFGASRRQ